MQIFITSRHFYFDPEQVHCTVSSISPINYLFHDLGSDAKESVGNVGLSLSPVCEFTGTD